jgi:hypothetical protein
MSNHCKGCKFNPSESTGEKACPFTTLYWDYLNKHSETLAKNPRMVMQLKNLHRLNWRSSDDVFLQVVQAYSCRNHLSLLVCFSLAIVSSSYQLTNLNPYRQLFHLSELSWTYCFCMKSSITCISATKQNCQIHQVKKNLCVAQAKCWILQAHQCFGWVCKPPMLALRCKHIGHQYRNFCCFDWYYRVFSQVTLV